VLVIDYSWTAMSVMKNRHVGRKGLGRYGKTGTAL